jgi:two-component system, NtrC family, sensor kinase
VVDARVGVVSLAAELFGSSTVPPEAAAVPLEFDGDEDAAHAALVAGLDRAFGGPRRLRLPGGTELLAEDEELAGLFVVVEGRVVLSRRDMVHHAASTGRIVGLSALLAGRGAQFTARADGDVEVVPVSFAELSSLLVDPALAGAFITVLVRSLARRHRRAVDLAEEVESLNGYLHEERDRLAEALRALDAAQTRVVEAARLATLGELAAGFAHELNNPVAAIGRAAAFVAEDVVALLADPAAGPELAGRVEAGLAAEPSSSADARRARRALAERYGAEVADLLVAAGVVDAGEAQPLVGEEAGRGGPDADGRLARAGRAWQLGTSLRNLRAASERIGGLVSSLRGYARPDAGPVDGVDVRVGLEDTLRLYAHALGGVAVERRWDDDLPLLRAWPGRLHQVWSNLVANASDALDGAGHLVVSASSPEPDVVEVVVVDDGPGVPPELRERIFERFYRADVDGPGIGLGLAIARTLAASIGATLRCSEAPGGGALFTLRFER